MSGLPSADVSASPVGCRCRRDYGPDQDGTYPAIALCAKSLVCSHTMTVRAAAKRLGLHENTVRKLIANGTVQARTMPGSGYRRPLVVSVEAVAEAHGA